VGHPLLANPPPDKSGIVIFCGLSNILIRDLPVSPQYQLHRKWPRRELQGGCHFLSRTDEQWIVFFFFFFCGMSWHLSNALYVWFCRLSSQSSFTADGFRVAHLVGYNMQWASTIKEVEVSLPVTAT